MSSKGSRPWLSAGTAVGEKNSVKTEDGPEIEVEGAVKWLCNECLVLMTVLPPFLVLIDGFIKTPTTKPKSHNTDF